MHGTSVVSPTLVSCARALGVFKLQLPYKGADDDCCFPVLGSIISSFHPPTPTFHQSSPWLPFVEFSLLHHVQYPLHVALPAMAKCSKLRALKAKRRR
jgi:hypothetical protein